MARFVIFGAGAVGGVIGACLHRAGREVVLVARGAHYEAIRDCGLRFVQHGDEHVLRVDAVDTVQRLTLTADDVVVLAMKTQHTLAALDDLDAVAPAGIAIVCAQNGVENERMALRRFEHVYAMCVMCPTGHLEAGVVEAYSAPITGLLDLGRYPAGSDDRAHAIAAALQAATFESLVRPDIMRWKYTKLLMNLNNALPALFAAGTTGELAARVRAEAVAVLERAGIEYASEAEDLARRGDKMQTRNRTGGSTWQSLERGTGNAETGYLNGEIVLLGRLHGVPTPENERLVALMAEASRNRRPPGSYTP